LTDDPGARLRSVGNAEIPVDLLNHLVKLEAGVRWQPMRHTRAASVIEVTGAGGIVIGEVVIGCGKLNQALEQLPFRTVKLMPQRFPRFVGLEVRGGVEQLDPFEKTRLLRWYVIIAPAGQERSNLGGTGVLFRPTQPNCANASCRSGKMP
jgi:hypothetical protein